MKFRSLGRTWIQVSVVSFGAGPVSGWSTSQDVNGQIEVVKRAIELGVNWFDTAPTYSEGRSETALGHALTELQAHDRVHLATKVRLTDDAHRDVRSFVLRSFEASLQRLQCSKVTLLQLHNSITAHRNDQPTSVTTEDVLGPKGILAAFEELRDSGVVGHLGLTGLGDPTSLRAVIESGQFEAMQTPYNLLNPSAGQDVAEDFNEANYGNLFSACQRQGMGTFAIRVFAGGALAHREPSAHTKITKFFPLDLYQRDLVRADELLRNLPAGKTLPEEALRFVLSHPAVTSALIGFGRVEEVEAAVRIAESSGAGLQ